MTSLLVTLFAWSGTAYAGSDFDPSSVSRVAVFGFGGSIEMEQAETKTGLGALDAAKKLKQGADDMNALSDGSMKAKSGQQAVDAYNLVTKGLAEAMGWEVLPLEEVSSNDTYAGLLAANTSKQQQKMAGWGSGMAPEGIIHPTTTLRIKQDGRDSLIEALGVDALALVDLTVTGRDQGVRVGGIGTSRVKPRTTAVVTLFTAGEKKKVWRATVTGDKTDEAIAADFGGEDRDAKSQLVLASMANAMEKLGEKHGPQ